ncbi:MAG: hypothetical protein ACRD1R_10270 [Acidobacteriota bacterium]
MRYLQSVLVLLSMPLISAAQDDYYIPPPLRVYIPFEAAWEGMIGELEKRKLELIEEDRGQGRIFTEFREYISGPLTERHLAKVGRPTELTSGDWLRVKYQYDIRIELVESKETLVTVYTNIKALKREFLAAEEWVDIPSNGNLEEGLLTDFGQSLFGQNFRLEEPRKGFWKRDPKYVPNPDDRIPRVIGPERP